jgi:shikimate kinase
MNIILIGYRGSGKTTVGRKLGAQLGKPFIDCDDLIIAAAGKSIRQIFADHGEEHFRDLESGAIANIAGLTNHVIALGGGALGREANRAAVKSAASHVIYLHADPAELRRRIEADAQTSHNRPHLTPLGGGLEEITLLLEQREPIYKAAMTHELDVTNLSPEQAVEEIARLLKSR